MKQKKKHERHVILNRMRKLRLILIHLFSYLKQQYGKMRRRFSSSFYSFFYDTITFSAQRPPPLCRGYTITFRHSTLSMTPLDV